MLKHYSEQNPQYFDKDGPDVARCVCSKADCVDVEECLLETIDQAGAQGFRAFSGDGAINVGNDAELTAKIVTGIDVTIAAMSEHERRASFYVPMCTGGCGHYAHQCECTGEVANFAGVVVHYIPESL